ncbi:site-specific tyrosine recombinase XerC [Legionella pneumophila]|uniref:tyrosine-type recombinase/integrase n=1 Tax=Legionella pneumophila TaxID=446 RepID=UPI0007708913|nr:site-specific tyrosine recombinase XerC [Legionella pneumophila]CZH37977.1 site-specific tyrosine recombinase XerC [Legionella pneumophila]
MGRKRTPGLQKRGSVWCIDKKVFGRRLCESTGTDNLEEAEKYLARRLEEIRLATVYGVRPKRTFKEAATKFLMENQHKRSISDDAGRLRELVKYIGDMPIEAIHIGSLQPFIEGRKKDGVSCRTINHGLKIVRRILNLAASEWMDEFGLTWLTSAPKIKLLPEPDLRKPYPLSWDEQHKLFDHLPDHLKNMALFAVNTGCRDREICELRWDWLIQIPELPHIAVFIIPGELVKNGDERLVVCNETARSVIEGQRGKHPTHVFSFRGRPLSRILSTGWRQARVKAGLPEVRVHDLKHTFGRRLRAAGVSFEDRQDLLGHRSGRITTHYSSAELQSLYLAANKVCENRKSGVILTLLRNPKSRPASQDTQGNQQVTL